MDCLEAMRQMKDNQFDLAICDPPFGINAGKGIGRSGRKAIARGKHHGGDWDLGIPTDEYFEQLARVSRNQIIWGGNYFPQLPIYNPKAKRLDDFRALSGIVWDKGETMYGRDFSEAEIAYSTVGTGWFKLSPVQAIRSHPTAKPIALYRWLIHTFAKKGDSILDTHLGSQNSRIAAHQLGHDFEGYETDAHYFERGCLNFELTTSQSTLF